MDMNEEQTKNLMIFLSRVQLTGAEVPVFNELLKIINEAKNDE